MSTSFREGQVEVAAQRREETAPELLGILEDTVTRAKEIVGEDPDGAYFAHLYAMYLLAQFAARWRCPPESWSGP